MQSIFLIKDEISKKECGTITSLFGVTATQVREFFSSQRSRVRRFVRLSREKAIRLSACKEPEDGPSCSSVNTPFHQPPLNCVGPSNDEGPSSSSQDEVLPGVEESDKHFVVNIFRLMRKEESFSGQVKLLEWILQIQDSSVQYWFMTKGGVMILVTWLTQAAVEGQTSVLHVILKVLCHLPLQKALPAHMSAILQSVNKLRFYRTSDISNRAKIMLSRWSKIFARSQALRKSNGTISPGDAQDDMLLKQSIGEIMGSESWKIENPDGTLVPSGQNSENSRNLGSSHPIKLLLPSTDDSKHKLLRGVSSSQNRERRKVQLVEQPGQRVAGRGSQVAKSVPAVQSRPLSADDIQKAKLRAQFMQSKYGRGVTSLSDEGPKTKKIGGTNGSSTSDSKAHVGPSSIEPKKRENVLSRFPVQKEAKLESKRSLKLEEPLWKKCQRFQIPWRTPPEMRMDNEWSVAAGESSKEVEVQNNRIRREKGVNYSKHEDIPLNPKEPWDREMDYDDSLTPVIPTEQLPDEEEEEEEDKLPSSHENQGVAVAGGTVPVMLENGARNMAEPDLDLLAVLLKNPDVVFALTSGQGGGLSGEQMVKVLDAIKASGSGLSGSFVSGLAEMKAEEKVEVSLPSPTPSSELVTSGWRQEVAKNPFSRQSLIREPLVTADASSSSSFSAVPLLQKLNAGMIVQPEIHDMGAPGIGSSLPQLARQAIPAPHEALPISSNVQVLASDLALKGKHVMNSNPLLLPFSTPAHDERMASVSPLTAHFDNGPMLRLPARPQVHAQLARGSEGHFVDHSSRIGHATNSSYVYPPNHYNDYNSSAEGHARPPLQATPYWTGNGYAAEPKFGSLSPDSSPVRSRESAGGWNHTVAKTNTGQYRRPDERFRPRAEARYGNRDQRRNNNPRWRDRRR